MQGRSVAEKIGDTRQAWEAFREELTPQAQRELLEKMTGPEARAAVAAAAATDPRSYAAIVRASLDLYAIIAANDRMALMAAATITQSGVVKPVIEEN